MTSELGGATIASAAVSLFVILGMLMGAALLARKLRDGHWGRRATSQSQINIIASRSLGAQSSLLIVEAEGQRFLVGAGRAGLTAIGSLGSRNSDSRDFDAAIAEAGRDLERSGPKA